MINRDNKWGVVAMPCIPGFAAVSYLVDVVSGLLVSAELSKRRTISSSSATR